MEIVHVNNETWQLISGDGSVLVQGTRDECLMWLCELESHAEYRDFLQMSGI